MGGPALRVSLSRCERASAKLCAGSLNPAPQRYQAAADAALTADMRGQQVGGVQLNGTESHTFSTHLVHI